MKKIDSSVIITSLISGMFGILSTILSIIIPRILDRQQTPPIAHLSPSEPVPQSVPRESLPLIEPRRAPQSTAEELIEEVSLLSTTDILYIAIATLLIIIISVTIVEKIRRKKHSS